jgi:hypothetical protein
MLQERSKINLINIAIIKSYLYVEIVEIMCARKGHSFRGEAYLEVARNHGDLLTCRVG